MNVSMLSADLAAAGNNCLFAGQRLQREGAADVHLLGGNAHLRAETELSAVGKARRCVDVYRGRIDLLLESACIGIVFGDDGLGMVGGMLVNVMDRLGNIRHDLNGQNEVVVFCIEVLVTYRDCLGENSAGLGTAAEFYAVIGRRAKALGRKIFAISLATNRLSQALQTEGREHFAL